MCLTIFFFFFSDQEACYWGTDISDSQLEGAGVNIKTAGLVDKIELLKASVKGKCVSFQGEACSKSSVVIRVA